MKTMAYPRVGYADSILPLRFTKRLLRYVLLILSLFCSFGPSVAQNLQLNDTILLPDVEIIEKTALQSKDVFQRTLDTLSMQAMRSTGLADLLSQHSAVFVKNYGPGTLSTVSLRGTSANHTLVLWNDLPINAPMLGQVDFSQIPVFFIDQVDLCWGSASASKRAGGLGGTVSLDNKMRLNRGLNLEISQSVGNFGTYGTYTTVDYSNKKIQLRTRLFRKVSRNDFTYENTASLPHAQLKEQNAEYADYGIMQEIHLSNRMGNFSLISWNQWNNRNLPPIMTNLERGGNPEEFQNDRFHRNLIRYLFAWKSGKIECKSAYFIEDQQYYLRTTTSGNQAQTVTLIDSKNRLQSFYNQLNVTESILENLSIFGHLQWNHDKVISNNYDDTKQRAQSSISVGAKWDIHPRLNAELNVNQDLVGHTNIGLNPSITVHYQLPIKQNIHISTGISKNYRLPSMNDLYWYPGGNTLLKPERGITTDISAQWIYARGGYKAEADVNVFFSTISDWIQWRPTEYRYWIPLNIARVFARGIEFHCKTEGKLLEATVSLSGNYVITLTTDESQVAKLENSAGRQLIYIPKHHANVFVSTTYKSYLFTYTLEITGRRTTSVNSEDKFTGMLPTYMLHHVAIGKKMKHFTVDLRINNLCNKSYQTVLWRAMPGRNAEIFISYIL